MNCIEQNQKDLVKFRIVFKTTVDIRGLKKLIAAEGLTTEYLATIVLDFTTHLFLKNDKYAAEF